MSWEITAAWSTQRLKDRTHDATLRATLRAMGWTHGAIVAWNVAEVELASTPATLRAILHAMLHRVSGPLDHWTRTENRRKVRTSNKPKTYESTNHKRRKTRRIEQNRSAQMTTGKKLMKKQNNKDTNHRRLQYPWLLQRTKASRCSSSCDSTWNVRRFIVCV